MPFLQMSGRMVVEQTVMFFVSKEVFFIAYYIFSFLRRRWLENNKTEKKDNLFISSGRLKKNFMKYQVLNTYH